MAPPPGRMMHGPKTKDVKGTIKRLLPYLAKHKFKLLLVFIFIALNSAAGAAGSMFLKPLIDDYIGPLIANYSSELMADLAKAILMMAFIYLVGVASGFCYNRLMIPISQGVLKQIRDEMFEHMQTLPIRYFDTHSHGNIMSHYTNDTDTLRQLLTQTIPQLCSSVITVVVLLVSMISTSIWLTLVVLAFTFLMSLITKKTGGLSGKYFIKQQRTLGDTNGFVEEMINGQKVVKVFCHEDEAIKEFDQKNADLFESAANANTVAHMVMPIMMSMGYVQYVAIAIVGSLLAINGVSGLTLGAIVAFLQLSQSFNRPINMMSQQISSIVMALAGAERIFELMDEKPEEDSGYITLVNAKYDGDDLVETPERTNIWAWRIPHRDGTVEYKLLRGDVRLENVDFGYTPEKQVLYDVNVYAEPGQKVAFVGATGAGKTTITNLINRFYDIQDGQILYDGIDIKRINKESLRLSLGIVLQDINLFTGTVMENIRYGRLDATDEECIAAAQLANAHGFITLLENGYDTVLSGDGSGLSQGQRQLIAIARAAVADPPVMILDEATSSIDTRTESIVQSGMDSLMTGRTVFVIAHRLSTVQNSDVIMVLEHGHIIERGNHDKLIANKGKYYQLYTGAFELE